MFEKVSPFNILTEGEEILLILHRHWIAFVFLGFQAFFMLLIPAIVLAFQEILLPLFGEKIFWAFISVYCIISMSILFISWINLELDFLIMTNQRFISIQQRSFLSREVVEINLNSIQEVRSKVFGILPNIFGYGQVSLLTANNHSVVSFLYIPKPMENIKKINEYIKETKDGKTVE